MSIFSKLKKEQVQKETSTNKEFKYKKGEVHLIFTLNINSKKTLKDFVSLLEVAIIEVKQEIEK